MPHTNHPDSNKSGPSDRGKEPSDGPLLSLSTEPCDGPLSQASSRSQIVPLASFAHLDPPFPHSQWEPPARIYTSVLNGAIATGMRLRRRGRPWAWAQRIALAPTSWRTIRNRWSVVQTWQICSGLPRASITLSIKQLEPDRVVLF